MLACSSSRAVKLGYELQSKLRLKLLLWRAETVVSIYFRLRIICLPLFSGLSLGYRVRFLTQAPCFFPLSAIDLSNSNKK